MTECSQWHHVRGHWFQSPHLWFRQQKVPNTPAPASLVLLPAYSLFNHFYILSILSSFPHVSSSQIHCAWIFRKKKANLHFAFTFFSDSRSFWFCCILFLQVLTVSIVLRWLQEELSSMVRHNRKEARWWEILEWRGYCSPWATGAQGSQGHR